MMLVCPFPRRAREHPAVAHSSLRNRLGKPLIVRTGYCSPSHNCTVGGAPASKHTLGTAFDIAMSNHDPTAFAEVPRAVGFLSFGTYPRSGFMHIDLGPARCCRADWHRRRQPCAHRRLEEGSAVMGWLASILTSVPARKALGPTLAVVTISLFLLNLCRAGDRAGPLAERISSSERTLKMQRKNAGRHQPPPR